MTDHGNATNTGNTGNGAATGNMITTNNATELKYGVPTTDQFTTTNRTA